MRKISVLIADDHFVVRQGLRALLETQSDLEVVAEAADGLEAVRLAQKFRPDVALMDLIMPNLNGAEATKQVRAAAPDTAIIILTSFLDCEHVLPAVQSGALSFLLKDVGSQELLEAVRKAARGEAVWHPSVTARLVAALGNNQSSSASRLSALSEREREVLSLVAQGQANHAIAASLFISEKTVKTHVSSILAKLDVSDRTQAAVYAWKHGLMKS